MEVVNYEDDRRRPVAGGKDTCMGEKPFIKKPLNGKQVSDYELTSAPDNPDRKRSITARLKEGVAKGQGARRRSPSRNGTTRSMRTDREGGWFTDGPCRPVLFLPLRVSMARSKLTEIAFYCKLKENLKQVR